MSNIDLAAIERYLLSLQDDICQMLKTEDGEISCQQDDWTSEHGGGGITRAFENGPVVEKAGVNFSHVHGDKLPAAANDLRPEMADHSFHALGVSVIVHPRNPYAPTSHFNVRFFMAENAEGKQVWWFGGGFDLTPYYGFIEDCQHFHQQAMLACQPYGDDVYARFKQWADDYFYLKHRQEPRGIGGIFFDNLNEWGFERSFEFMQSVGAHFIKAYQPILAKRKQMPYGEREREFQRYRRGRYVEFNLVYDRGTHFGLQFGGRTESILISLPPVVHWRYDWQPEPNSPEAKLISEFLAPKDWVAMRKTVEH